MALSVIDTIFKLDKERDSFPGEHWIAFGVGTLMVLSAMRRPSMIGRLTGLLAGGALIVRAASGRDGVAKLGRVPAVRRALGRMPADDVQSREMRSALAPMSPRV